MKIKSKSRKAPKGHNSPAQGVSPVKKKQHQIKSPKGA